MNIGRRATDRVSTEAALELLDTLAYENALEKGDKTVIDSVSLAIVKLRDSVAPKSCRHCGEMPPGFECKHCRRLA